MNILDLLKKYESDDSINYLRRLFGSDEFINDIFTDTMGIKYVIDNMNLEFKFYEIFHNIYVNIENDKTMDNTVLNCLIILDSYYKGLNKPIILAEEVKKNSIKLTQDDVSFKLNEKIRNMYNIDSLPNNYKYYKTATDISNDIKDYSLDKQYNLESAYNYKEGLNSVTVLTPTQTISRFNDESVNGLKGSGHHDANFDQIVEAVYGKQFLNGQSGQDIRIRHIAEINDNNLVEFKIAVDMPYVINSTQLQSLKNLNDEIKRISTNLCINFEIHVVMTDYENRNFVKFIENKKDFDEVINIDAVDDVIDEKYKEVCFLGHSNLDNHYKKIDYVR